MLFKTRSVIFSLYWYFSSFDFSCNHLDHMYNDHNMSIRWSSCFWIGVLLVFFQLFQFREKEMKLKAGTEDLADINVVGPSGDSSEVLPSSVSLRQIATILDHFTSLCCLFFSIKICILCMFVKLLTEYSFWLGF